MKHKSYRPKKADLILLLTLLLLTGLLFALRGGQKGVTATVSVDGQALYTYDLRTLDAPETLTLQNGVVIEVSEKGIAFLSSDCRGQDCVNCGRLTKAGQAAACVPNKTLIMLQGAPDKSAPDAISY